MATLRFYMTIEIASCANWSHSLEPADLPKFTLTIRNSRKTSCRSRHRGRGDADAVCLIVDRQQRTPKATTDICRSGSRSAAQAGAQGGRRCFYLTSNHQSANPTVPRTAVMAVEISNESAASLIQSVTVHNFQSAPLPRVPVVAQHVANVGHRGRDLHRGRVTGDGSHTGGRSRSIKFHNSPNDQNCSINLKR